MKRQQAAERALHDQTNILPRGKLLIVFAGMASSLLICFVDQNGIGVTLPTIGRELHAQNSISWAGTSSLIANTVFTVLYGRLSDIFGRKVVFILALCLLCIADLLCGLSQSPAMFYVFRGIAGIAGGGVTSLSMIIVSDIVTLKDRGKYQGILGSCVGTGNIIGPFIAAAFVMRTTWRAFFWMISPLAAIAAVIAWFLLPNNMERDGFKKSVRRIDFYGVLTSSVGIIFILIPISGGGSYFEWDSPMVISMLTIGACSLIAFLFIEWKVAALPMTPISLFRNKVVAALLLQSFLLGAAYQSYLYYLPLYFQNVRQWSAIESAAMTVSMVACQSTTSILSGQYISLRQRYGEVIWSGFGIWTLGTGLTLLYTRTTSKAAICIILALVGLGIGNTFQPTLVAIQAHCTKAHRAVAISNRNFFRCFGGACGLAMSAAVLQATLKSHLPPGYKHLARSTYSLPAKSSLPPEVWEELLNAYMKACHSVFILQVPLVGVCFLACLIVKDRGLERPKDAAEIEAEMEAKRKQEAAENTKGGIVEYQGQDDQEKDLEAGKQPGETSSSAEPSSMPSKELSRAVGDPEKAA